MSDRLLLGTVVIGAVAMVAHSPACAQAAQPAPLAKTSAGVPGQRQEGEQANTASIQPTKRINTRLVTRVENRIENRLDADYQGSVNSAVPIGEAFQRARRKPAPE